MIRKIFLLLTTIIPLFLTAAEPVVIIYGHNSLPNDGERNYAKSLATHAKRWYLESGVTADLESDINLTAALKGRKVALLVNMSSPLDADIATISKFLKSGGRIISTFSLSQNLGALMGVSVGKFAKLEDNIYGMSFVKNRPPNIDDTIRQNSSVLIAATPIQGKSRTIATWCRDDFSLTQYPACIESPQGYWFTHVLLAEGDTAAKGRMLTALSAKLYPPLWKQAAIARLTASEKVGTWANIQDAKKQVLKTKNTPRRARILEVLEKAQTKKALFQQTLASEPDVAWKIAGEIHSAMLTAYSFTTEKRRGEICGIWDHSGQGLYKGDWDRTCKILNENGISDIFVCTAGPGFSHANIANFPHSALYNQNGDQLKACTKAARKYGLRIHAWLICYSTTLATQSQLDTYKSAGMLLQGTDGKIRPWFDPSSTDARKKIVAAAEELLTKYDVDGIHLDFCRYPDYYSSLGEVTRIRFVRDTKVAIPNWPDSVKRGPLFKSLVEWRTKQVTKLIADVRTMQRKKAPKKLVSVAVLGKYPDCVESVGQDYMMWLKCGYVDYVCPMNYTENLDTLETLLAVQTATKTTANHILCGIGVTATESRLDAGKVIDQIRKTRKHSTAGFVLFNLDATLEKEILPNIKAMIGDEK